MPVRPNLLVICTDQQSAHMMGCAGTPWVKTPAMDRLAAAGRRFKRCYVSNPVCMPSRLSLYTGHPPSRFGMRANEQVEIPDAIKATGLGHLLTRAGYTAAFAGKEHLPRSSAAELGFDYLCKDERDACATVSADFLRRAHDRPFALMVNLINPHDICYMAIRAFATDEQSRGLLNRGRIELEELDRALQRPPGVDDDTFFRDHAPPLPPNFEIPPDEPDAVQALADLRPFRAWCRANWTERDWRLHRWAYARLTERVDAQVGIILDALDASGQAENTVIIFTSDHGDLDGTRRLEHKTLLYDEASRVPLICVWPGHIAPGSVDHHHLVNNGLDLMPTLCDLAGITPPADRPGRSILPLWTATPTPIRDYVFTESQVGRMARSPRYKYIVYETGARREEFFDLHTDKYERQNRIADPTLQPLIQSHRHALATWIDHIGDAIGQEYIIR